MNTLDIPQDNRPDSVVLRELAEHLQSQWAPQVEVTILNPDLREHPLVKKRHDRLMAIVERLEILEATKDKLPATQASVQESTCCGTPAQCWEPCGELGKSAEHARPAEASTHEGSVLYAAQNKCSNCNGEGYTPCKPCKGRGVIDILASVPPPACDHVGMWSEEDKDGRAYCRGCGTRSSGSCQ